MSPWLRLSGTAWLRLVASLPTGRWVAGIGRGRWAGRRSVAIALAATARADGPTTPAGGGDSNDDRESAPAGWAPAWVVRRRRAGVVLRVRRVTASSSGPALRDGADGARAQERDCDCAYDEP